jgi:hypothetical protein
MSIRRGRSMIMFRRPIALRQAMLSCLDEDWYSIVLKGIDASINMPGRRVGITPQMCEGHPTNHQDHHAQGRLLGLWQ